jgi:hypothetical protein
MKSKITICAAIMLFVALTKVHAQDAKKITTDSKGFIGISGGYSLPFGNFTKSDYLDLKAGFAKAGPVFSLDGGYFFNKHIGAGLVLSRANYGIKAQDVLSAGYVEAFAVDEVTMTVSPYTLYNILPALYYTIQKDKLNIDFRLMIGYSSLTVPKIQVQLEDNADSPLIQNQSTGGGLGFGIGAGARYKFASHFGAALRIDYLNSKPNVNITYTNLNNPTDEFRYLKKYNESIGVLNASLGLYYSLDKK